MKGVGAEGFNFAKWVKENQNVIEFSRTDKITVREGLPSGKTSSDG